MCEINSTCFCIKRITFSVVSGLSKKNNMESTEKGAGNSQFRERTMVLALAIRNLVACKKVSYFDRSTLIQLIRSSSSVAANYRSATRARSDGEFYSKICIVVEECDETLFWIEYLIRSNVLTQQEVFRSQDETEQLLRVFSSIKRKMKDKLTREKGEKQR